MKNEDVTVVSGAIGAAASTDAESTAVTGHFFKREDWLASLATFLFSAWVFFRNMAPEVTLQDSGELVTGAFTFGVPHPPGYPIWAFMGWVWSRCIVFWGNPAWRIGTMSAFTGALTVGVMTLMMTRSVRVLLHALPWAKALEARLLHWAALGVGMSASLLFGFNRGVWLWASVSEMRVLNAFSFVLIACFFFAWMIQPQRKVFLYSALLAYGLSMTNHQTVAVMALALVAGTLALGVDDFFERREAQPAGKGRPGALRTLMSSLTTFWNLLVAVLLSLTAVFILFAWLRTPEHVPDEILKLWSSKTEVKSLAEAIPSVGSLVWWRVVTFAGVSVAIVFAELQVGGIASRTRKLIALAAAAVFIFAYWRYAHDPVLLTVVEVEKATQFAPAKVAVVHRAEMRVALGTIIAGLLLLVGFSENGWVRPRMAFLYTVLFLSGCAFYLYMPVASSTNPPMNWGYAATKEGFHHAITRGQYQKMAMADPCAALFGTQLKIFTRGLCRQYSPWLCLFALVPPVLSTCWLSRRLLEDARRYLWLAGVWVAALPVAVLSVWALRYVFVVHPRITADPPLPVPEAWRYAYLLWGLALPTLLCMIIVLWLWLRRLGRSWMVFVWAAFLATSLGLIMIINPDVTAQEQEITIKFFAPAHGFFAMLIGYGIALAFAGVLHAWRNAPPAAMKACCAALLALPYVSYRANWDLCALGTHDFGYQFGYRMFCPGGGYPDMAKDAVLFGGTDPGRFVPTYMIFCESAVKPRHRYQSPWMKASDPAYDGSTFDRSDVYIITQNALADNTYMGYIRDHYDHTRPRVEGGVPTGNITNRLKWQQKVFAWGWTALGRQNDYPKKPIRIPTQEDSQKAFHQLVEDWRAGKAPPNAELKIVGGKVQVTGALGVMAINGILARWIFDWNKEEHDFYVEESYVIPWMYPYLRPAGVIMKIEKEPLPPPQRDRQSGELEGTWKEIVEKDKAYWDQLTGEFLAREEFCRSKDAQKSFAKMRSAIAGLYLNRALYAEAEYAFKQAVDLCPESPEGRFRLAELYMNQRRYEEARDLLAEYLKYDQYNQSAKGFYDQLDDLTQSNARLAQLQEKMRAEGGAADINDAFELLTIYARMNMRNDLLTLGRSLLANTNAPPRLSFELGMLFAAAKQAGLAQEALTRYTTQMPRDPRGWVELGWLHISQGKSTEGYEAWLNAVRTGGDKAREVLRDDPRFAPIWQQPDLPKPFLDLLPPPPRGRTAAPKLGRSNTILKESK
ncbi:MAG: DUF2723 domain-containing protein [Kiritimatiellaeota bacterium]|nr:DUF2723 domain-containing protein [Kiritimatiellota bacterium]